MLVAAGERMRRAWLSFAHDGTVDEGWPTYDPEERRTLIIDAVDRVESDPRSGRRKAWQQFVPHL